MHIFYIIITREKILIFFPREYKLLNLSLSLSHSPTKSYFYNSLPRNGQRVL